MNVAEAHIWTAMPWFSVLVVPLMFYIIAMKVLHKHTQTPTHTWKAVLKKNWSRIKHLARLWWWLWFKMWVIFFLKLHLLWEARAFPLWLLHYYLSLIRLTSTLSLQLSIPRDPSAALVIFKHLWPRQQILSTLGLKNRMKRKGWNLKVCVILSQHVCLKPGEVCLLFLGAHLKSR